MQECIVILVTNINNKSKSDLILLSETDVSKLYIYKLHEEYTQYNYESPYFIEYKGNHYNISEDSYSRLINFKDYSRKKETERLDKSLNPYI